MQVPAPFEYERATSVDHAIGLLERLGSERPARRRRAQPAADDEAAAGQPRVPRSTSTTCTPSSATSRSRPTQIRIGAMTRHRELLESDALAAAFPIFRDAERVIADPVVRNRGTIGGSLCQADPSEDLSAVCTTLNASCVIRGSGGERVVTMEEFHRGPYETAVGDAEMLIEVRIPIRAGRLQRLREGRAPSRRLGSGVGRRRGLAGRRRDRRRPRRAGRGRARTRPASRRSPRRCAARRRPRSCTPRPARIAAESCSPATDSAAPRTTSGTWPTS